LFVPLHYNDGTPIEPEKLRSLQDRLLDEFNGLTVFPQPNQGYWRYGHVTYRDEIIILRVVAKKRREARRFLKSLKEEMKRELEQKEVLIIERDVESV
jgi:molybdopterin synthase catalytic subunit